MVHKIKNFIKKNQKLYIVASSIYYFLLQVKYFFYTCFNKVNEKAVLFISFMGEQYSDNPRRLYEKMCEMTEYNDFTFYFVFKDVNKYKNIMELKNAKKVKYLSKEFYKACAISKYWISNARMRPELFKRKNQIYLQTWHGTPFKKLGYDIGVKGFSDIGGDLKRLIKNYRKDAIRYDYILSPSLFYTEKITSAFGLKQIGKSDIFLEYGYPRNDILFTYSNNDVKNIKNRLNLPQNKKVILYAPTFREKNLKNNAYGQDVAIDLDALKSTFEKDYVILFRLHYYISSKLDLSGYKNFIYDVSDYDDIANLYIISDILITDYSSVFFDYANLMRPIIFYMYDLQEYSTSMHDFYLKLDELPGIVTTTQEELFESLLSIDDFTYDFMKFNKIYNPHRCDCAGKILEKLIF